MSLSSAFPTRLHVNPTKIQIRAVWSVCAVGSEDALDPSLPPECAVKAPIGLRGCAG